MPHRIDCSFFCILLLLALFGVPSRYAHNEKQGWFVVLSCLCIWLLFLFFPTNMISPFRDWLMQGCFYRHAPQGWFCCVFCCPCPFWWSFQKSSYTQRLADCFCVSLLTTLPCPNWLTNFLLALPHSVIVVFVDVFCFHLSIFVFMPLPEKHTRLAQRLDDCFCVVAMGFKLMQCLFVVVSCLLLFFHHDACKLTFQLSGNIGFISVFFFINYNSISIEKKVLWAFLTFF